jgi:hypothetical protein
MPQANTGKEWTPDEVQQLRDLAEANTPVGVISMRLERSEVAAGSRAPQLRTPYGCAVGFPG